jgi:hypothetical protein
MVHQNSLNQEESKDFHQEHHKLSNDENPKIEPLFSQIWEGNQKKRTRRVHAYIPNKSQRERPRNRSEKIAKKRLRKSPKRKTGKNSNKP